MKLNSMQLTSQQTNGRQRDKLNAEKRAIGQQFQL